jgi:hypothetical protein
MGRRHRQQDESVLAITYCDLLQDNEVDIEDQVNNDPAPPQRAAVVRNAVQKRQTIMQQLQFT